MVALILTPQLRSRRIAFQYRARSIFEFKETSVRYLPGWTVQCINPECMARGHWLRADAAPEDLCSNCGEPLQNVPPPLSPQLRLRPRPLTSYRPNRRAR